MFHKSGCECCGKAQAIPTTVEVGRPKPLQVYSCSMACLWTLIDRAILDG